MNGNIINVVTEQADVVENVVDTAVDAVDTVDGINASMTEGETVFMFVAAAIGVATGGYLLATKVVKPLAKTCINAIKNMLDNAKTKKAEQTEQTENTEYDPESDAE